jgi:RNA polymerase sigma-70 factor (ECF subfamily)
MSPVGLAIGTDTPDVELVRCCRAGDEAAVRELTRRYNRRLFRIARSILRDDSEAEDVVQDTYVRAFTHLDSFRGDAGVGTWLVRIAMNEALGRKRRQRPTVDVDEVPMRAGGRDPEALMAQEQLRAALERAIDRLPEPFRIIFVARLVEGMTIEETAAAFGLRPETVKTRVHRARVQLRRILEQDCAPMIAQAFAFDGERCQRMTDAVVRRLREPLPPSAI